MYGLSVGVQHISQTLPNPVYALLSGLNASTVGIVAVAAVQLAEKAIRDKLSRILVIFGACAGLCYNALWYFPVLLIIGGLATAIWDGWMSRQIQRVKSAWRNRHNCPQEPEDAAANSTPMENMQSEETQGNETMRSRKTNSSSGTLPQTSQPAEAEAEAEPTPPQVPSHEHAIRIRTGLIILVLFLGMYWACQSGNYCSKLIAIASFVGILVARGQIKTPLRALDLFANMYLAGTIIFGGGPVVIPLLRSYVVGPGWVSSRDFLIGLAIIQAFPGPNFNFAVYLGSLSLLQSRFPTAFGAFLGGLGIFVPGITLAVAVQSFWRVLRKKKYVIDFLRGVNATAVGLVFTAVYRLWEIGYLTPSNSAGQSLANNPWWVVVAAVTYAESAWFGVSPPVAIMIGAVLGLCWYGAVGQYA